MVSLFVLVFFGWDVNFEFKDVIPSINSGKYAVNPIASPTTNTIDNTRLSAVRLRYL